MLKRVWKLQAHPPPPILVLFVSSIWLFLPYSLYNKLEIVSAFLSPVNHSKKLQSLRRWSWELLMYSRSVKSTEDLDLGLASEVGAVLWG